MWKIGKLLVTCNFSFSQCLLKACTRGCRQVNTRAFVRKGLNNMENMSAFYRKVGCWCQKMNLF